MRKTLAGVLVALFMAIVLCEIATPSECKGLSPDNWFWWWFFGCSSETSGGGGSGAS